MAAFNSVALLANVLLEFPGPLSQGPLYYAQLFTLGIGLQAIHNGEWAAIPFFRELGCVPAGFNLLDILEDEVVAIKGLTDENRTYQNNLRKGHLISG
jgi:hypothetical protein